MWTCSHLSLYMVQFYRLKSEQVKMNMWVSKWTYMCTCQMRQAYRWTYRCMYRCTHLRTHLRTHMRTCTLTCAHNMRVFKNPRAHLRIHMHIVHALYVCVLLKKHVYDLLDSAKVCIYIYIYIVCRISFVHRFHACNLLLHSRIDLPTLCQDNQVVAEKVE